MRSLRNLALSLLLLFAGATAAFPQELEEAGRFITEKDWVPWDKAILKPDTVKKLLVQDETPLDFETLAKFTNLQGLILIDAPLKDLRFLSALPELRILELQGNSLRTLEGIQALTHLREFSCHSNFISDLSPLDHHDELRMLKLYDNEIEDLSGIAHLTSVVQLDLAGNPIRSIEPIAEWTQLRSFSVYKCAQLKDITPIGKWRELEDLNISFLDIPDFSLSLVGGLTKLTSLRVQGGMVRSNDELRYIMHHTDIEQLTMGKNDSVTTIDSLRYLVKMKYLDIHSNNVTDIGVVRNFPGLVKLVMYRNDIADISPLLNCPELRSCFMHENPIRDYGPLYQMGYLQHLNVSVKHFDKLQQQQLQRALRTTNITFM